jgi:hypothetical protein
MSAEIVVSDAAEDRSGMGNVVDGFRVVSQFVETIVAAIPMMEDGTIIGTWQQARGMGAFSWYVEAACAHQATRRVHARTGRGHKDLAGEGVEATLVSLATEVGRSPERIRRLARVYEEFFAGETPVDVDTILAVPSVSHWEVALDAKDSRAAIDLIASGKDDAGGLYSVANARAETRRLDAGEDADAIAQSRDPIQQSAMPRYDETSGDAEIVLTREVLHHARLAGLVEFEVVSRPGSITLRRFRKGGRR